MGKKGDSSKKLASLKGRFSHLHNRILVPWYNAWYLSCIVLVRHFTGGESQEVFCQLLTPTFQQSDKSFGDLIIACGIGTILIKQTRAMFQSSSETSGKHRVTCSS